MLKYLFRYYTDGSLMITSLPLFGVSFLKIYFELEDWGFLLVNETISVGTIEHSDPGSDGWVTS